MPHAASSQWRRTVAGLPPEAVDQHPTNEQGQRLLAPRRRSLQPCRRRLS